MTSPAHINRKIVLASRPTGLPTKDNFALVEEKLPVPRDGQVLVQTIYLSLDPYMRGRMSDAKSYAESVAIGGTIVGGTVSRIVQSKSGEFREGDIVLCAAGWQTHAAVGAAGLIKLDRGRFPLSYFLGVLGMPGLTAYVGLLDIGRAKAGETIVVSAASGAVGSVAGQIAKIKGMRAIGIAGGARKCAYLTDELGFDASVDYKAPDFMENLKRACPNGIDVYFDNVGGDVLDAVFPHLNIGARVPVCGRIAHSSDTAAPSGPNRLPGIMAQVLIKRILMQGFIIFDHQDRRPEFLADVGQWVEQGGIKYREDVTDGLENAPEAFIGLLTGRNFGKSLVRLSADAE